MAVEVHVTGRFADFLKAVEEYCFRPVDLGGPREPVLGRGQTMQPDRLSPS
jgi:hypothetical protein